MLHFRNSNDITIRMYFGQICFRATISEINIVQCISIENRELSIGCTAGGNWASAIMNCFSQQDNGDFHRCWDSNLCLQLGHSLCEL